MFSCFFLKMCDRKKMQSVPRPKQLANICQELVRKEVIDVIENNAFLLYSGGTVTKLFADNTTALGYLLRSGWKAEIHHKGYVVFSK